jgi:hypothetical protein
VPERGESWPRPNTPGAAWARGAGARPGRERDLGARLLRHSGRGGVVRERVGQRGDAGARGLRRWAGRGAMAVVVYPFLTDVKPLLGDGRSRRSAR